MAENVNGIGTNPISVTQYNGNSNNQQPKAEEKEPETKAEAPVMPQVSPDDVLSFMAMSAAVSAPTTQKYDVSKYVSPEQAARIAEMMAGFEGAVVNGLSAIEAEFGDKLSDEAKYELAAALVE